MSEIQVAMNFELLPNEILIECFEYLNGVDIFHSFDQLNYRLNKLIRSIPLNLDFQNISKSIFDQFCKKLMSNEDIKTRIHSLQLSNKGTCYQIQPFLSHFSLNEFSHLRSLTLIEIIQHNIPQLISILPLVSQLSCLHLIDHEDGKNEIFSTLPIPELRTLTVPRLFWNDRIIYDISSIRNLTIFKCDLNELHRILNDALRLKYLNVKHVSWLMNKDDYSPNRHAIHLKQLVIKNFGGKFPDLVMILQQTPNLKSLIICANLHKPFNSDILDAPQWEYLISSSLPYLKVFKFHFYDDCVYERNGMNEKCQQFQSDFWQKQHHWYIEYLLSGSNLWIYTIPCISDRYILTSWTKRYPNELMNNSNLFDNVTNLIVCPYVLRDKSQYHFSHVTSLTIGEPVPFPDRYTLDEEHIESLKMLVNLSSVKHLSIECDLKTPSLLLEILKQTPQLFSINHIRDPLKSLLDDDELCKYLTKMITEFHLVGYSRNPLHGPYNMDLLGKIFPNIEQFTCMTEQKEFIVFLLKHLSKLTRLNVSSCYKTFAYPISSLEEDAQTLGLRIIIDCIVTDHSQLSIWIIRDMS